MTRIGKLRPGDSSVTRALSSDGEIAVGESWAGSSFQAFRWTQDTGIVALPSSFPGADMRAYGLSGDGRIVVGYGGNGACAWFDQGYPIDLTSLVGELGLTLVGGQLTCATAISSDGSTIAGYGSHNGSLEGYVLVLPAPGAGAMLCTLLVHALGRNRRPAHGVVGLTLI